MRFTKISRKTSGKVFLGWTVPNGDDKEERSLSSHDAPLPRFKEALENLKGDMLFILELPKKFAEKLEITTVSIDTDKDDNRGYILSGVVSVGAGKFSVSTPRMREPGEDSEGGATVLTDAQLERLAELEAAARGYVEGDRVQQQLELDEKEEPSEEPVT